MWPKIQRVRPYNFGASGSILTKLFQTTCCEAGVIIWVQFWKARLLKFGRAKNVKIMARFLTTFDFDREYLRKESICRKSEKKLDQLQPLPRWGKKIW